MEPYSEQEAIKSETEAPEDYMGFPNSQSAAKHYLKEIRNAKNNEAYKRFLRDGKSIIRKYKNLPSGVGDSENSVGNSLRTLFNILWSNVQTLKPTLFSRVPKIVVERRLKSEDPTARLCALIGERCCQFSLSQEEKQFKYFMDLCVEDRLLPGRGQCRVLFKCDRMVKELEDGAMDPNYPCNEQAKTKYVYWEDFLHATGQFWDPETQVPWIAFRHYMDKRACATKFGKDKAEKIKYRSKTRESDEDPIDPNDKSSSKVAEIWEVQEFHEKKVCWVSEQCKDELLLVEPDNLKLNGFYTCPRPIFATTTTDSLIPTADYKLYDFLADELNYVLDRVSVLIECCRFVGFHDATVDEHIRKLVSIKDGTTVPMKNWQIFAEGGGLKGSVVFVPIEEVARVIKQLVEYGQQLLQMIWEVTGMPDIVRGNSNPNETATAQQYKGQFATLRISHKQEDIQRFIAELCALKGEIIFELFSDETIMLMSDYDGLTDEEKELFPAALQILRDDKLRSYKIDIETDSTLAIDEETEKAARMEFIQALGNLLNSSVQAMQLEPATKELMMEALKFGARGFRQGRELEGMIEATAQKILEAEEERVAAPPPPDPAMLKAETDQMIAHLRGQIDMMKAQQKGEIDRALADNKVNIDRVLAQNKMTLDKLKAMNDAWLDKFKAANQTTLEAQKVRGKMATELVKASRSEIDKTIEGVTP